MSTIINSFRSEHDGIIKIKCDTKEITGEKTSMTIDLSSDRIMEVSTDRHYWPRIYAWVVPRQKTEPAKVDIEADYNCSGREVQPTPRVIAITPNPGVTFFTLKLINIDAGGNADPNETVTVGEEPPNPEEK